VSAKARHPPAARVAFEAAAWAFAAVLLALASFFYLGRLSVPMEDFAAFAAALGLVGSVTGFVAVATLARSRFLCRSPVLGAILGRRMDRRLFGPR
jgi:hypothetical protein